MARPLLLLLLFVATVVELALAGGAFFAPAFACRLFGVKYSPDTAFLVFVVGWLLLFVALVAGLAFEQVRQRQPRYATLCYLLGIWWLAIGIGICAAFGKPDNLLLDSLKGLLIIVFTWRCQATRMPVRRY